MKKKRGWGQEDEKKDHASISRKGGGVWGGGGGGGGGEKHWRKKTLLGKADSGIYSREDPKSSPFPSIQKGAVAARRETEEKDVQSEPKEKGKEFTRLRKKERVASK